MSDERPQSVVQASGQVASDVVSGLKSQPMILALVVLNVVAIGAAVWFLRDLAVGSRETTRQLINFCFDHKQEKSR